LLPVGSTLVPRWFHDVSMSPSSASTGSEVEWSPPVPRHETWNTTTRLVALPIGYGQTVWQTIKKRSKNHIVLHSFAMCLEILVWALAFHFKHWGLCCLSSCTCVRRDACCKNSYSCQKQIKWLNASTTLCNSVAWCLSAAAKASWSTSAWNYDKLWIIIMVRLLRCVNMCQQHFHRQSSCSSMLKPHWNRVVGPPPLGAGDSFIWTKQLRVQRNSGSDVQSMSNGEFSLAMATRVRNSRKIWIDEVLSKIPNYQDGLEWAISCDFGTWIFPSDSSHHTRTHCCK
jgi:hypothetical protein